MNSILTVADPLVDKTVTIVITLVVGGVTRDERLALVSVGLPEQPPVTKSGRFAALLDLIDTAWTAYGVQAELAAQRPSASPDEELLAEEEVAASAEAAPLRPTAVTTAPPPPPRPQAGNLSLF